MDAHDFKENPAEKLNLTSELKNHIEIFKPKFAGKITFKSYTKSDFILPKQDILQVIDILLDNATKYGDQKISITLNQNSIIVTNDGATISQENLEKIFDRFYQTDKTTEGSGLGLAIAKAICEQNNWQIHCESKNHITKFIVTLSR